ncbi:MAG: biotin transporter BioY [Synergistetes bacterium]|nr:biotin transporter BioY [Synergistota bacterium]
MNTSNVTKIAIFVILTSIGAFLKIPFFPVPLTLQTLFVILSGIMLEPRDAALSQTLYITIGLSGIPVFANGGGISYILSPTFGYIVGFIPAAYVVGKLSKQFTSPSILNMLIAATIGTLLIYLSGLLYLYINMKYIIGKELDIYHTLLYGCLIFLPGDATKIIASALIGSKVTIRVFQRNAIR